MDCQACATSSVVSVIWSNSGVSPDDMEKRIVTVCERAMTTTVNDIEHIESQSYYGVSVVDDDGVVHFQKVSVGYEYGASQVV